MCCTLRRRSKWRDAAPLDWRATIKAHAEVGVQRVDRSRRGTRAELQCIRDELLRLDVARERRAHYERIARFFLAPLPLVLLVAANAVEGEGEGAQA